MAEGRTASPQLASSTADIADHFNFPSMSSGGVMSNGPEPSFAEVKGAASATDQLPVTASDTNSAASLTAREVTSHASGFSDNSSDSETPTAETALVTTAVSTTRSSVASGAAVAVETLFTTDSELAVVSPTSSTADPGPSVVLATSLESTSVTTAVRETTPTPELSVVPVLATSSAAQPVTTAVTKATTAPTLATFPTSELVTPTATETASTPEVNTTPVLSAFSTTGSAAADVTSSTLAPVESNVHSSLPWTVTSTFRGASSAPDGGDPSPGVTAPAGGPPSTYVTGVTEGAAGVGPSLADAAASTAVTHDSGTAAAAATDSNLFVSWTIEADATSSETPAARTSGISSAASATHGVETPGVSVTSFLPLAAGISEVTVTGFTPHASETSGVSVTSTSAQAAGTSDVSTTSLRTLASSSLDNDTTVTPTDLFLSTTTTMPPDSASTPRESGASNATVSDVFVTTTDVSAAADNASDNTTTMSTPLDVTDTTVAPPAQSSPHTSLASTPDHLSSTVTGAQRTTDLDGSGYMEGGSGGAISDRPTTSGDEWPSVVSSLPERGHPRVTSLDNGTSNGTVATSHAGLTGNDALIIILPVCLTIFVFIVIIIALALFCYRRKRKKQEEAHHSNEDLWVKPPTESLAPLSVSSGEASVPDNVPEKPVPGKPVYTVIHEFPALQATQLSLTVGDSVVVEEKADNGWWRGYIAKNPERSGWFPSSFVEGIKDENSEISSCPAAVDTEVESASSRRPTISSFLIRKKSDDNPLLSNSFSLGKLSAQSKAASVQDRSNPVIQTASPGNVVSTGITADDLTNAVQGKHFKALFAYKAAFRGELTLREGEIIIGKERDRNGWMLGTKLKTKEEGWFPAVYVDQIVGELPQEETPTLHVERMELDQEVYGQLAVNRTKSPDQAWLGIEHVANYGYHGHSERELNFKKGDVLTVFEAQESGWWLGCHGDNVGWFPGTYVELLEQKSDNDGISLELLSPQMRNKDGSSKDSQSQRSSTASSSSEITKDSADMKSLASASSESIIGEKPKPARKAPHPPSAEKNTGNGGSVVVSGTGTLSRNLRPVRPAPAPPTSRARPDSVSSMDRLSTTNARMNHGIGENNGTRTMPLKKTRKPKIVRIPKEKVGLDKISSCAVPKRPVPSVHEGEKPQKDDKENNTKCDKEETTKQDSDCTSDGEIEKECSLLAECMSKLVSKTSDVDGVSSEAQVHDTKTNNTDIFNSGSPTNDDPDGSSVSHSSDNQNCSPPFTPNQDQGEKITCDPNADPMLTSQISDQSNLSTEEEAFPQQGNLPDFSDSKPNPHSNHGTSNEASGHVHGLPNSDSWGNIGERMSPTPASQEESVRESMVLPPSEEDSHVVQVHNPSDPQPGNSSDSSKPSAMLPDSPLVSELPSSPRYSGHWKFHRDREHGQKPLRLTKVPPPVVPVPVNKKDNSEDDGEEMLGIPPPGVSGHVSMIVHQINQRLSMDPKNIDRKPSRQLSSSSSGPYNEEYGVPNGNSADENSLLHHQINHSSMVAQTNAQNALVNGLDTNDTAQSSLAGMVSSDSGKQTVQCKTSDDSDISNTRDSTFDLPNVYEDTGDDIHRPASIMKTKRPPPPKSPPPSMFKKLSRLQTPRVWRTLKNYSAQRDDELSYSTGVFIREISESEERPGWVYGMLTDGAAGFFSVSFAEIASSDIETEL